MRTRISRTISSSLTALALFGIASFLSLNSANAQQGGVAILDIDKVAQTIGIEGDVKKSLKEIEDNLNTQLRTIQTELQARFDNLRSQVGPQPSQDQSQQLAKISGQLTQQLAQSRTQAQNQLSAKQFELVSQFREEVKPVALKVAQSKGLSVVITPDQSLFVFAESVDITEEVTAEMKKIMPAKKATEEAEASTEAKAGTEASTEADKPE